MRAFEEFLKPTQKGLFKMIRKMYAGKTYVSDGNFILVRGDAPIMLVAHLDTVHNEPVEVICKSKNKDILMSPQGIGGDDRCGVYALNKVYELAEKKPWLLFTCDEETGGQGAHEFCRAYEQKKLPKSVDEMKCLVEIDRRGRNDAVYYDCENLDFERYITGKGFVTAYGSFSDISLIAPALSVAAVNLSSGYYNAHSLHEYIVRSELERTIERVVEIVADASKPDFPKYDYFKKVRETVTAYSWSKGYFYDKERIYGAYEKSLNDCEDDALKFDLVEEERTRKELPREYEDIYDELLDIYTAEELELYRAQYGDRILYEIYIDEYGPFYAEQDRK